MKPNHPLTRAYWIWPRTSWIWADEFFKLYNTYAQFRHDFQLPRVPRKAPFFITADQSYRLFVNGRYIGRGPARGYQASWPYDEYDLAAVLRPDHNWISIEAYNPGLSNFQYLHQTAAGMLCAAEWGQTIIRSVRDGWLKRLSPAHRWDKAAQWADKKNGISAAVEEKLWNPALGRYSSFLYPDGRRYAGLLVNGLCTPYFLGVEETRPGSYAAGIAACGRELMTAEGLVRGNSDTDLYAGLSPVFYLHALGSIGSYEAGDEYLESLLRALPASGGSWEYTAVDCPVTGSDKRRGGDSGVLFATLAAYTTGFLPTWDGFVLRPHLPRNCRTLSFTGLRFRGNRLSVVLDEKGARVKLGRRLLPFVPRGSGLEWNTAATTARLFSLSTGEHPSLY
jgi:hypothetical protein